MKFEETLQKLQVPEWKSRYIQYGALKQILENLASLRRQKKTLPVPNPFEILLMSEFEEIDNFYKVQEANLLESWQKLVNQVKVMRTATPQASNDDSVDASGGGTRTKHSGSSDGVCSCGSLRSILSLCTPSFKHSKQTLKQKKKILKKAFEEFYRVLDMLQSYVDLNRTGVRKIVKKYDKNMKEHLTDTLLPVEYRRYCFSSKKHAVLARSVENAYTAEFADGDRRFAMQRLRVPENRFVSLDWSTLAAGVLIGASVIGIAVMIVAANVMNTNEDHFDAHNRPLLKIFRGLFIFALYPLLLGSNTYVFHKVGVNFAFIMNFSPKKSVRKMWKELILNGSATLFVWTLATLSFVFSPTLGFTITPWAPLATVLCMLLIVARPYQAIVNRHAPFPLWIVGRVLSAPFFFVNFADFFTGDQMNSLVIPILDLEYAVYYLTTRFDDVDEGASPKDEFSTGHIVLRALIAMVPAWTRFVQCLRRYHDQTGKAVGRRHPHLTNAGKYACSFFVVTFSVLARTYKSDDATLPSAHSRAFFALWIMAALVNMTYTIAWDLLMDWGLFRKEAKHKYLRNNLMYPPKIYYAAMVYDVIGRASWVLSISVGFFSTSATPDYLTFGLALVEVLRRYFWNFIRLENEHLNNCGEYRASRDIPMPYDQVRSEELNFGNEDNDDSFLDNTRTNSSAPPVDDMLAATRIANSVNTNAGSVMETRRRHTMDATATASTEPLDRVNSVAVNAVTLL